MSDTADKLDIKELPIPTAQRLDVFVCNGVPDDALERWSQQGGNTNFWRLADCVALGKSPASFCGIALFIVGGYGFLDASTSEQLSYFFARAGTEANVFQWQPIERNFVRRDRHWFDERRSD